MNLKRLISITLSSMILFQSGCCWRSRSNCDLIDNSIADAKVQLNCGSAGQISSSFDSVHSVAADEPMALEDLFSRDVVSLDLHQCCCAAAINAVIADAIDKERKAFCCENGFNRCVDEFLAGQALQQRNRAASRAGELFLRLVEIGLQEQLLNESLSKLSELKSARQFAADQGFATADAEVKIRKQEIELKKQRVKIKDSEIKVLTNLNTVLGVELECAKRIEPEFHLNPIYEPIDVRAESELALSNRPDLQSIRSDQCGCFDDQCYAILSQLDPRIGIGVSTAIKKTILLKKLCQNDDCADCARRQQLSKLKMAREELVRLEVAEVVRQIETGYRSLSIENEDLARLEIRLKAIEFSSDLQPSEAFIDTIENWTEQQKVKSARISKAIEFEIAKLKLLEVTGQWTQACELDRRFCRSENANNKVDSDTSTSLN